jgi:concentrative nucleoside transporter, CNT family
MDTSDAAAPSLPPFAPTPFLWRLGIAAAVAALAGAAYLLRDVTGPKGPAAAGVLCFIGVAAVFSTNLRAVSGRTIFWGFVLQVALALLILKVSVPFPVRVEFLDRVWIDTPAGYQPGYELFRGVARAITKFLDFSQQGAQFIFGKLADPPVLEKSLGPNNGVVFAFVVLPTIIFVSSFFSVLYHLGVLQFVVRLFARAMVYLMRTSGAETLSAAANVFMGQTEAPLIVKPYVPTMTQSELLAMMVGGMATIAGGVMTAYIQMGADPVAILTTSVMAAPCGLYLAKILLPETGQPVTRGTIHTEVERPHRNVIEAAAAGASDGLYLALNVAAMLIAFLAFLALIDFLLGLADPRLSLGAIFSRVFWPVAFLIGVEGADVPKVADLLGIKLVANEFVAYAKLTNLTETGAGLVPGSRAFVLATYALTGFANFSSIGIQLGGIGGMAPTRRADLARLGGRALLGGFLATLINAALAGLLIDIPTGVAP